MREKHSPRRYLVAICLALLMLLEWSGVWQPTTVPVVTVSAQTERTAGVASDDAQKLLITLDVLESSATTLRKTYEADKDCRALRQAQDVIEALLVLAPAGSESYLRGKAEWNRIIGLIPRCNQVVVASPPGSAAAESTKTVVIRGGGGCTSGLLAELVAQDRWFISDYAERAKIEMDVTAISGADRILLDVTPGKRGEGTELPYRTIQPQCDPRRPGVKGMSEVILSYNLMTAVQQSAWLQGIPNPIKDLFLKWSPTNSTQFPWPVGASSFVNPTRPSFGPGFGTPAPAMAPNIWGIPLPAYTQPAP
jgi:hypothetical protein